MKNRLVAAALLLLSVTGAAFAAEADGVVQAIDSANSTITLDDGETYKLPGEFDVTAIQEGMDVVFAYDEVDGEKLITDIQLPE